MADDLAFTPAAELARRIRAGDLSPVDVVDAFLERIGERNDVTNAYVTVLESEARDAAREAERAVEAGERLGPLHGVPVAIKDLTLTAGVTTTFGSKPFADFVPEENAVLVDRLERAGAIVLGKTNTPEFGHKGTTVNPLFGATGTPFDPGKTAGGSSGGSAAAVADGLAALGQGSDAGGSVRIPAACCGLFGLMPSFGRIPQKDRPDGLHHTPFGGNGPLARTVEDAALMLEVMAGPHPRDPFALPDDGSDYLAATRAPVDALDVAFSPDLGVFPVDDRVRAVVEDAVAAFSGTGATVEEATPAFGHSREAMMDSWKTGFQVALAAMHENFRDGMDVDLLGDHRDELTPEFAEHIEAGGEHSGVDYKRADVLRTEVVDAVQDLFDAYDLLVTPTLAVPPFDTDVLGPTEVAGEEIDPLYGWFLTWPFNMTGHPAASIPAGFTDDGLPVGLQLVGRRHADETVLAASGAFQRVRPWADAYPPGA